MSRSRGVERSGIGCKAKKTRAWSGGLSCPPNHPRSVQEEKKPYRDFDASCKTGRLRARKRLTP